MEKFDIKSADMLEFSSDSVIGKVIRWRTGKDVNHSSLVFKFGELYTLEALGNGIDLHLLKDRIDKFRGRVYWYPLHDYLDEYRDDIMKWALMQIDKMYDYESLVANLFGRVSIDGRLYFCSEYVFVAYKSVGLAYGDTACRLGEFGQFDLHKERVRIK